VNRMLRSVLVAFWPQN